MSPQRPDRDTLMAYADGQLDDTRHAEVDRYLEHEARLTQTGEQAYPGAHTSVRAEIAALQAQNLALREALAPLLDEPVPARLLQPLAPPARPWVRAAAVALWIGVGAVAGSLITRESQQDDAVATAQNEGMQHFVRQAELAYAVYTPDARRPVEVREESDLTTWLSRRLQRPIVAPDALPGGLVLMGGRLLPGMPGKPAAQLMYQDAQGHRVTVYLRGMARPTAETSFRIVTGKHMSTFYWVDRQWGYALTGDLPRAQLLDAARALYQRYTADDPAQPAPTAAPQA
ncbi:anti-sigma factor family protein [Thiomonas bhubaneswarensis]|uniref:Transmembrane transcriptional regulator (Anti-sigma factor RsiW) n=1 Tax=Thiomonas bhubaneswarensis TaxID=339866 RepID=A0A0K6HWU9_9BURK|nr:anti-sigma factor [Thiomonas bhubaneswarensis]CUA95365.1 Transmembrane transcriptional regulator (anti-sigma factor RsiW) [Thiomonas bhubaneswarensis]